jgi:hypothetical protein
MGARRFNQASGQVLRRDIKPMFLIESNAFWIDTARRRFGANKRSLQFLTFASHPRICRATFSALGGS